MGPATALSIEGNHKASLVYDFMTQNTNDFINTQNRVVRMITFHTIPESTSLLGVIQSQNRVKKDVIKYTRDLIELIGLHSLKALRVVPSLLLFYQNHLSDVLKGLDQQERVSLKRAISPTATPELAEPVDFEAEQEAASRIKHKVEALAQELIR